MSDGNLAEKARVGLGRRSFLKLGLVAGAVAGLGVVGNNAKEASAVTYHDSIDDIMEITDEFERYDQVRTAFNRTTYAFKLSIEEKDDRDFAPLIAQYDGSDKTLPFEFGVTTGYTTLDMSYRWGTMALNVLLSGTATGANENWIQRKDGSIQSYGLFGQEVSSFPDAVQTNFAVAKKQMPFESPEAAAYAVKKAVKKYGASSVGIAPFDERFTYKTKVYAPKSDVTKKTVPELMDLYASNEFTFEPKSVVVFTTEMDYESYKTSPTMVAGGADFIGYSNLGIIGLRTAMFLRKLGYNTRHSGNDVGPNIPNAIAAGLGESSRMGILVTKEFGPRVRIGKVFTDLEMTPDKPVTFGVRDFCQVCQVCSDGCPSGAINKCDTTDDPENKPYTICEQTGVKGKWYVNAQKCIHNWNYHVGSTCGICISICPYNKPQTWNHELVKMVTLVPGLNSMARYFDHFFGFGTIASEQEIKDFWVRAI